MRYHLGGFRVCAAILDGIQAESCFPNSPCFSHSVFVHPLVIANSGNCIQWRTHATIEGKKPLGGSNDVEIPSNPVEAIGAAPKG